MKKLITHLVLFILILLLVLVSIDNFLKTGQKNTKSLSGIKLNRVLSKKDIDPGIMIFGSSIAEGGIIPNLLSEKTKLDVFNCALSGRRVQDWNCLANEFLGYSKNSKILIFDVFPYALNWENNLYFPHEFYPFLNNKNVRNALSPINDKFDKMTFIPFYDLTQLNSTYLANAVFTWRDFLLGKESKDSIEFEGYNKVIGSNFPQKIEDILLPIEISEKSKVLYEDLINKAKNKEIKVVFYASPIYRENLKYFNGFDEIIDIVSLWQDQFDNVYFVDYSNDDEFIYDKDLFYNSTHMNFKGATLLTSKIADHLISNEITPNK